VLDRVDAGSFYESARCFLPHLFLQEFDDRINRLPAALAFVEQGVRAMAVRLAPTVHGQGDRGFIPRIIKAAQKRNASAYIGDGSNRWPAVHRLDAARLFRLAVERGEAGVKYHGVAEQGLTFRQIAQKIADKLQLPTASCSPKEAAKHFGFMSLFVGLDNPASSDWTREKLAWMPQCPSLLDDLDHADYFQTKLGAASHQREHRGRRRLSAE
jgi:nucleoside-diphosphate-sugar epimerase